MSKSFFCFWTKNYFEFCSAKSLLPSSWSSKIEIVATSSERHLPTAMSYFNQENWFWKWIWKTMGEVDLDFKWAASNFPHRISSAVAVVTIKIWSHQPSCNQFPKALPASSMLILSRKSDVCFAFLFCQEQGYHQFQFYSHHMKGKILWKIQFAKAITACIFASARRWKKIRNCH